MVKDREDNDKLLVCAEENNVYLWEATDGKVYEFQYLCKLRKLTTNDSSHFIGSNPTGEFFNPAYDCSDVLNKISDAKDGLYWIILSRNVPKRVLACMGIY